MNGGGARVTIPASARKMVQNIKEIAGNYSDEEIYAMLQECGMNPDEAAQRLLAQDPFHEVKSKRDKRKENLFNKESAESQWRPGTQRRGNRGARANFSSRYTSHDAGSPKNFASRRENGTKQVPEKTTDHLQSTSQEAKNKEPVQVSSSAATVLANGPADVPSGNADVGHASDLSVQTGVGQPKATASAVGTDKLKNASSSVDANKNQGIAFGSDVSIPSSDPVTVPSNDSRVQGTVVDVRPGLKSDQASRDIAENKSAWNSQGVGKAQATDSSQVSRPTSAHSNNLGSRPPTNYSSRSHQIIGPQRVGSNKEWKPKPVNPNGSQGSGTSSASEVPVISVEASSQSLHVQDVLSSDEATSKLQKKLENLHISQRQHVIIPNHIQVPEATRTKLSFGSFDAGFDLTSSCISASEGEKSSTPLSQTSQDVEQSLPEASSDQNAPIAEKEGDYSDTSVLPSQDPEDLSGDGSVSTNTVEESNQSKQESNLNHEFSVVHTSPNYSIGFVPPVLGSQLTPSENTESQARDASRLPGFVVQPPFDPASYYAQFYRSGADADGRVSPFFSAGVPTKFNGNVTILPQHTSQPSQEGGNSLVISTAAPTPLVTQAAGLMQSSIAVTQQPVPVFRPPAGLHISHYPPSYFPYGHYISPFYVPPPGIHQFISNGAFAQQPQASSVYPGAPPAAATGVKYSLPQYKPGNNAGNLTHLAMPSGYGPYGSFPAGYNPGSAPLAGNSTANEDLSSSQLKESNVYSTGQQSEGTPVWIAAPGRDVSSLPASSFYNLPPQGQHVTFAPTQAAHGSFGSVYHPAQGATAAAVHPLLQQSQAMAGAVDMVGPAASVYQQPQQSQINWPSNY